MKTRSDYAEAISKANSLIFKGGNKFIAFSYIHDAVYKDTKEKGDTSKFSKFLGKKSETHNPKVKYLYDVCCCTYAKEAATQEELLEIRSLASGDY